MYNYYTCNNQTEYTNGGLCRKVACDLAGIYERLTGFTKPVAYHPVKIIVKALYDAMTYTIEPTGQQSWADISNDISTYLQGVLESSGFSAPKDESIPQGNDHDVYYARAYVANVRVEICASDCWGESVVYNTPIFATWDTIDGAPTVMIW